ncbi:MAG: type I-E CRISPR-associated endoribonuclease Cas2 [Rhizobiaceae bacterium]|nr:type I-E CRISPR-associated endoribonuclease Cas2 [Rhizobiaceae bacterium]
MTVIVTRDVPERTRGFLASVMPEPAPGVYVAGNLSRAVRERAWAVVSDWHAASGRGSIVMFWKDDAAPGGVAVTMLGTPPRKLADLDGVLVSVW